MLNPCGETTTAPLLYFLFQNKSSKMFKRTVISFLCIGWKKTSGNFPTCQMRPNAIATNTAFAARVGTGTRCPVFFCFTFH